MEIKQGSSHQDRERKRMMIRTTDICHHSGVDAVTIPSAFMNGIVAAIKKGSLFKKKITIFSVRMGSGLCNLKGKDIIGKNN
jgi:hypothetical protein